ncbi:MAG: single-stranded-DNA-specific exonuclease RecJ [Bacteroidia bacterium]|nr:single-stranded-DNA-specific exonuclease RecJ [Bacteroidia bacterium]NNF31438.1 single-stranded-DNA-specific exonuclease RecJ [Flavobacteriaceae bacterium]NNK54017.1 single-stranded-DNA-specific exonuclease RecJ [Flavobacteriaceae bacterium]NNM07594.1 single-stranded-DNA-specific exonuclease RecJ [Flavobacteriaceae bacterium]
MRWTLKPKPNPEKVSKLSKDLQVEPVVAGLLIQRGIESYEDAKRFFRPELSHLHDPFLMKDMDKAVERIEKSIEEGENILIYGDYDVDGTSSVALLSSYLKTYYPNVGTYIPDRYEEGYGISYQGIDYAEDNDIGLIIALDCGIKALDKVLYASEKNIDFIICDHHRPGDTIPDAVAVLDPKRPDCDYPYKELCGCGVGFKLVQALSSRRGLSLNDLLLYLDLVVTAIGADIVPITGENRVLAYFGLKVINSNPRTGFQAILQQLKKKKLTITDVVFIIAPRINAAGRMKHGNHAVTLLVEPDLDKAMDYAREIEEFNTERRETDKQITEEALQQIREKHEEDRMTTVVYKENWHKGVIGIVASRLTETYYRPTLVFTKSGEKLAASARSVRGYDIYNALEGCAGHIEQFGGHKYAAGLTMFEKDFEKFKVAFERVVSETIDPTLLIPEIKIDAQIRLDQITPRFYRILKQFAPFGPGNMNPVFMSVDVKDNGTGRCVGEDKSHLRLVVTQGNSKPITGIGFGLGDKEKIACEGEYFKVAYAIDENEWNGMISLQLKIKDIKL